MIASWLQSTYHVGKDMLRRVACPLGYADDKHKDQGYDHGVLSDALALFACATLVEFTRQGVSPLLEWSSESDTGSADQTP